MLCYAMLCYVHLFKAVYIAYVADTTVISGNDPMQCYAMLCYAMFIYLERRWRTAYRAYLCLYAAYIAFTADI